MKVVYKVQGKDIFANNLPPYQTRYDREQLHDDIVKCMIDVGFAWIRYSRQQAAAGSPIIMDLMDRYGLDHVYAYLVDDYKPKKMS